MPSFTACEKLLKEMERFARLPADSPELLEEAKSLFDSLGVDMLPSPPNASPPDEDKIYYTVSPHPFYSVSVD